MSHPRRDLSEVATGVLHTLYQALVSSDLQPPIVESALLGLTIRLQHDVLVAAFAGLKTSACLALLEVVLAERESQRPTPELVWTGPETPFGTARDTKVVVRALFEGARQSVVLAGYSFDHADKVLKPLHEAMVAHDVRATFFVDLEQIKWGVAPAVHLGAQMGKFLESNWPFEGPKPRLFYDPRSLKPGPPWHSLHAKCVVVDGKRAFVSSANFTERGQERNYEVGVLVEDPRFASYLAGQWLGLVGGKMVAEYLEP